MIDTPKTLPHCVAFMGDQLIAAGPLDEVAVRAQAAAGHGQTSPILVFDSATSRVIDIDLRGTEETVRQHVLGLASVPAGEGPPAAPADRRGPGRPRLGVVAREVTLLPRHWEWLSDQPGGASAALRRLVDQARKTSVERDRVRLARESAYRFMSAMAGDAPGFEEATRALFAGNPVRFDTLVEDWPRDVREHARQLARSAFSAGDRPAPADVPEGPRD